ncbi:hypothetical protein [Halorarum halobium]|uniref:hypothetical protein n=1 Tax=Halorarum halobium TaxID=3075121 RepID=UPI0028AEDFC9|nr:hypothetical protein [Halobaculum sp. XH14]
MDEVNEILEGPAKHEDKGIAARLTYDQETDSYRVEYSPLLENGEITEEWIVFGGTVGYNDSVYSSEEAAHEFYDQLENLGQDEILDELAVGEE